MKFLTQTWPGDLDMTFMTYTWHLWLWHGLGVLDMRLGHDKCDSDMELWHAFCDFVMWSLKLGRDDMTWTWHLTTVTQTGHIYDSGMKFITCTWNSRLGHDIYDLNIPFVTQTLHSLFGHDLYDLDMTFKSRTLHLCLEHTLGDSDMTF